VEAVLRLGPGHRGQSDSRGGRLRYGSRRPAARSDGPGGARRGLAPVGHGPQGRRLLGLAEPHPSGGPSGRRLDRRRLRRLDGLCRRAVRSVPDVLRGRMGRGPGHRAASRRGPAPRDLDAVATSARGHGTVDAGYGTERRQPAPRASCGPPQGARRSGGIGGGARPHRNAAPGRGVRADGPRPRAGAPDRIGHRPADRDPVRRGGGGDEQLRAHPVGHGVRPGGVGSCLAGPDDRYRSGSRPRVWLRSSSRRRRIGWRHRTWRAACTIV
jgi:hypothetical protein